jgi:Protein of unknown function (DUF2867)
VRIANSVHEARPWRIHQIAPDFTLEDAWALPVHGRAEDFQTLLENMGSFDPAHSRSLPTRMLWRLRDLLGAWFGIGRISAPAEQRGAVKLPIPGTTETSLIERLPDDLIGTAREQDFGRLPFTPLYRTADEFAAELSNQTVHGVLHLGWVEEGSGRYRGEMAVYVLPRGPLGRAYMALIRPFRHLIVYPALMRQIEEIWEARLAEGSAAAADPPRRQSRR